MSPVIYGDDKWFNRSLDHTVQLCVYIHGIKYIILVYFADYVSRGVKKKSEIKKYSIKLVSQNETCRYNRVLPVL